MKSSRERRATPVRLAGPNSPLTPALCCDLCSWPMGLHEVAITPDGTIPGLLTCSLCVEDNLATRQLEGAHL